MSHLWVTVSVIVSLLAGPLYASTKAERMRAAQQTLQEMLRREAKGAILDRRELLRAAREETPNFKPVLWHSGFVYNDVRKKWLSFEEAMRAASEQKSLTAYRKKREEYPDTAAGQLQLAQWCLKRHLRDEARAHLAQVLEFNPNHAMARRLLGFRQINGDWVGVAELAKMAADAQAARKSLYQWRPKLETIRKGLERHSLKARQWSRQQLMEIEDPAAVEAIEVVLCRRDGASALLGVNKLQRMDAYQAAESLTFVAVFSPWDSIREAAAKALQSHRLEHYVSLLLASAESPITSRVRIYEGGRGRLLYRHILYREGLDKADLMVLDTPYRPASNFVQAGEDEQDGNSGVDLARADATQKALRREQAVARHNAAAQQLNARLSSVLATATGQTRPTSVSDWYDWWNDYNEVYVSSYKPVRTHYRRANSLAYATPVASAQTYDCLSGDVNVWTELGPTPIRNVKVGDRVFSCDIETGRLTVKPVLQVTVRPKGRLLRMRVGGEDMEMSGGHPLWVSGMGWLRARQLQPGMHLHSLTRTAEVESGETSESQKSYNLVVADFHTYFVGNRMVLTHDNTVRKPTNRVVPGLAADEKLVISHDSN